MVVLELTKQIKDVFLKVDGVAMPCPSSFTWGLQDISASESGRTDDTIMHKNRVGQKRKLSIGWNAPDWDTACDIIQAVNPEYIEVDLSLIHIYMCIRDSNVGVHSQD